MKKIVDEGHEIGAHGYLHENPVAMTPTQEEAVLVKSIDLIEKLSRQQAARLRRALVGDVGVDRRPAAEIRLHLRSQPRLSRLPAVLCPGRREWNVIDYSKKAEEWMQPLKHGKEIDLVEIGANWYVDDLPPMMFMKKAPNSHGFVNPRDIEELWRDAFDWVYREMDYAVFAFTIHPDVSGRPQVLLMLERLIEHINGQTASKWMTFEEIAADFRKRYPFKSGKRPEVI